MLRAFRETKTVCLVIALLGVSSCSSGLQGRYENEEYSLVRIELDRANLQHRGTLPVFSKLNGENFGLIPRAVGALRFTDIGRVVCRVQFIEPIIGPTGQPSYHQYQVVSFYGVQGDDRSQLVLQDDSGSTAAVGTPTVLHVNERRDELRVQPATREKLLPYVFFFEKAPVRSRPVHIPTVD